MDDVYRRRQHPAPSPQPAAQCEMGSEGIEGINHRGSVQRGPVLEAPRGDRGGRQESPDHISGNCSNYQFQTNFK